MSQNAISKILPIVLPSLKINRCEYIDIESPLRLSSGNSRFLFCCNILLFIVQVITSPILAKEVSTSEVI